MAQVGAAASSEDIQPRHAIGQFAILAREFVRVSRIELGSRVEFGMASARGVGAHTANSPGPWRILQNASEVVGVSTIDHEVRGVALSSLVDLLDRVG